MQVMRTLDDRNREMPPKFQKFEFSLTYELAGNIREEVFERPENGWLLYLEEFFEITDDFVVRALSPQKRTVLHEIVDYYVRETLRYMVRKADYFYSADVFLRMLRGYGVDVELLGVSPIYPESPSEDEVDALEETFAIKCQSLLVDEIFTLLFSDREFLLRLNRVVADCIRKVRVKENPDLLEHDGVVRRCNYWPTWLTDALLYRDRGRCALCLKDITGLLSAGRDRHIDHMVPLAIGGTNDPINLQYLCPDCNLKKSETAITSGQMSLYW